MLRRISRWVGIAVVGTVIGFSLQFAKAWTEPASAPPAGNVAAPVNVSGTLQNKSGSLGISGAFLDVKNDLYVESGEVGIGTTTPAFKLQVNGNIGFNGSLAGRTSKIEFPNVSGTDLLGMPAIGSTYYMTMTSNNIRFRNDTYGEVLSMYGGNVGIGVASPTQKLDVRGNTIGYGWIEGTDGTYYGLLNYAGYGGYFYGSGGAFAQNSSGYWAYLGYPGTGWSVYGNGNMYAGGYMQSQLMYDANDGNYYMDPNGTSRENYGVYNNIYSYGNVTAASTFTFQNEQYSSVLHLNLGEDSYNNQADYFNGCAYNVGTVTDTCNGNATEGYSCNPNETRTCIDYDYGWNPCLGSYTVYRTVVCKTASVFVR